MGKTFYCLQLAYAVATNSKFLDFVVPNGDVLYIAFENSKYSVKKRFETFNYLPTEKINFLFATNNIDFDLVHEIEKARLESTNLKLVIVDTFAKIRRNTEYDYHTEYAEISKLHDIAINNGVCIILVTHVIKSIDYNNPFENFYGSRGLSAGADGMMILLRNKNNKEV